MLHLYRELCKKYMGEEPQFKRAFQLHTIEWKYYGQYSGGARFFVVFPVKYGVRYLVEIPKDPILRNKIRKLLREWQNAVKTNDSKAFEEKLKAIFEMVFSNVKTVFRERMDGDTLIRERVNLPR